MAQARLSEAVGEELAVHLMLQEEEGRDESWKAAEAEVRSLSGPLAAMVEEWHWPEVLHELGELAEGDPRSYWEGEEDRYCDSAAVEDLSFGLGEAVELLDCP